MIEALYAQRRTAFAQHPGVLPELDLVEAEEVGALLGKKRVVAKQYAEVTKTAPKGVGPMNEEVPLDGRFECTIAAPSGTTYVGVVHQAIPAKSPREVGSHMQSDCWFLPSPVPVYLDQAQYLVLINN